MKILAIQFRKNTDAIKSDKEAILNALKDEKIETVFLDALTYDSVKWSNPKKVLGGYDALILGGSGELYFDGGMPETAEGKKIMLETAEKMRPFLEYILDIDYPTFGICLGHQLLAYIKGVAVTKCDIQSKTGTFELKKEKCASCDPVFKDFPETFNAQYGHKDALQTLPDNCVCLATSGDCCQFGAVRYGKNVYTTQFHPELTKEGISGRMGEHTEYLPDGKTCSDVFVDSYEADKTLARFVRFVKDKYDK